MCLHLFLSLHDKRSKITAAHVRLHRDHPLSILATDLIRAFNDLDFMIHQDRTERHETRQIRRSIFSSQQNGAGRFFRIAASAIRTRDGDGQGFQRRHITPDVFRKSNDDVVTAIPLKHLARLAPTDCDRDHLLHIRNIQPVCERRRAVHVDVQYGQALGLIHLHFCRAGHGLQNRGDLPGGLLHLLHVVTVDFYRDIPAHSGDQFVEAHLNRLREFVVIAGQLFDGQFNQPHQRRLSAGEFQPFFLRLRLVFFIGGDLLHRFLLLGDALVQLGFAPPITFGFHDDERVGKVCRHRVGSHFRRAGF